MGETYSKEIKKRVNIFIIWYNSIDVLEKLGHFKFPEVKPQGKKTSYFS